MKFDFGNHLRELRKARGFTQEQAAELMNISKQSLSRWENNTTCPDIMFAPVIASFYNVTVDNLLGVDKDQTEEILQRYCSDRQSAHHSGNIIAAFELTQTMYTRFPNNTTIINNMMTDSYLMGFHNKFEKKEHYLKMSVSVAERFLEMTDDIEEQCRCIKNIATCHKLLGDSDTAKSWLMRLPSLWSGIEGTAIGIFEGQDRYDSIKSSLEAALHLMYRLIWASTENVSISVDERIVLLRKIPQLFDLVFENGDFGFFHAFLCRTYLEIGKLRLQNGDDSRGVIDDVLIAAEHAKRYDEARSSKHTSVLFSGYEINPDEWTKAEESSRSEWLLRELSSEELSSLKAYSEWENVIKKLSQK